MVYGQRRLRKNCKQTQSDLNVMWGRLRELLDKHKKQRIPFRGLETSWCYFSVPDKEVTNETFLVCDKVPPFWEERRMISKNQSPFWQIFLTLALVFRRGLWKFSIAGEGMWSEDFFNIILTWASSLHFSLSILFPILLYWNHSPNHKRHHHFLISFLPSSPVPIYNIPDSQIILVSHLEAHIWCRHVVQDPDF